MPRDFRLLVFSWISFSQAPEYTSRAVSNFFENSRRYCQLKDDRYRWQMKKIFNQKNFNNFVGTPLDNRVNIYINFCLQVHFKVSAAWYCSHCLPPVSTTLVKLVSLIRVHGASWLAIISANFEKIWNGPNWILWGWRETDSWKKPEAKNLVTLSF